MLGKLNVSHHPLPAMPEESISLEETNKIRISLGLKPLTDDKAPADSNDQNAELNYKEKREQEAKDREAKRIQAGIAKPTIVPSAFKSIQILMSAISTGYGIDGNSMHH